MCRDSAVTSEMSHQWPRLVALGSMVALAGCGSSSPAPVPSTVTVPSPVPVQLSGVATDDDGAPVSGVTVFVYPTDATPPSGNAVTTVTDGSGRYSITFNSLFLIPDLVVSVHTEKSGYEAADYYNGPIGRSPGASTFVRDLRMYRVRYVPVGQSTTIEVKAGDPECAITDNGGSRCRTVRLTGPPGAMVAVQASTNPSTGPAQLTLDRSSQTCCSLAATANVPANGELRVYLGLMPLYGSGTYSFTLTSAILP
jgi:hypothetical protein